MLIGPVFTREAVTTTRRARFYVNRAVYVAALFVLMCTAWLVLAGTQVIRNVGDMARFGSILFQIVAPLQLSLMLFFSAVLAASAVAQEKDKKTLLLLLLTRLTNSELVLGKLLASLLNMLVMLAAALPLFMLCLLFGGVSPIQVARVYAVTVATVLAAGSLGSTLALWREKTFQTLALTVVLVVAWLAACEAIHAGLLGASAMGIDCETWAAIGSPVRAIVAAARPSLASDPTLGMFGTSVNLFVLAALTIGGLLNLIAIRFVRVWNPSSEIRPTQAESQGVGSIWGVEYDLAQEAAETARGGHIDARAEPVDRMSPAARPVWDNPVLWREIRTWAYGRKIILIRVAYLLLLVMAMGGMYWSITAETPAGVRSSSTVIPATTWPLALFSLVSLVIISALAVTSVTGERDGRALDLLLVTDLTPGEFIFGKLIGVFYVAREMWICPLGLCAYLWWVDGISAENVIYLLGGLIALNMFVAVLGLHCGMTYSNSRAAIGISLGTVFFLFLGVATCIMMMISFSGSFQIQLAPFLAFILGGGVGLYVTLGARNPSAAIGTASLIVPFATFYAIVSFVKGYPLAVFLVTAAAYSFTTAAMLIPALYEFDFAMGRTTAAEE